MEVVEVSPRLDDVFSLGHGPEHSGGFWLAQTSREGLYRPCALETVANDTQQQEHCHCLSNGQSFPFSTDLKLTHIAGKLHVPEAS